MIIPTTIPMGIVKNKSSPSSAIMKQSKAIQLITNTNAYNPPELNDHTGKKRQLIKRPATMTTANAINRGMDTKFFIKANPFFF